MSSPSSVQVRSRVLLTKRPSVFTTSDAQEMDRVAVHRMINISLLTHCTDDKSDCHIIYYSAWSPTVGL